MRRRDGRQDQVSVALAAAGFVRLEAALSSASARCVGPVDRLAQFVHDQWVGGANPREAAVSLS